MPSLEVLPMLEDCSCLLSCRRLELWMEVFTSLGLSGLFGCDGFVRMVSRLITTYCAYDDQASSRLMASLVTFR
jgi:hypothetical protein